MNGRLWAGTGCLYLLFAFGVANAAAPVDTLAVDLVPLIDVAAQDSDRFAVDIAHPISTATSGSWSASGAVATWSYSVRVPGAVSLSFHAHATPLPEGTTLAVTGASATYHYDGRALRHEQLWSRIAAGDSLTLKLSVPRMARSRVNFAIVSLQAGYRGLGDAVANHPRYDQLRASRRAGTGSAACVENYSCHVTAANQGPANSSVALVVENVAQCSGTLLNDVPGDGTPYVLTARHCETGVAGGGDPLAAGNVSVFWDAATTCGQTLGTIYDPSIPMQSGAITLVEQQDAWLIELDESPVVVDAYYAGWNASGAVFSGGYSIDFTSGHDKQYVAWFGPAFRFNVPAGQFNEGYAATFWSVVNELGSIGPGASGSALFDPQNHLVGVASRAQLQTGGGDSGVCPVSPPPAPNASNGAADFTALPAVFESTSDTSSSTGGVTISSVLDPARTGAQVLNGAPGLAPLSLTASVEVAVIGEPVVLSWSANSDASCTPAGGVSGDGWSGSFAAAGGVNIAESAAGTVTYRLYCSDGVQEQRSQVTVQWTEPQPTANFSSLQPDRWVSRPVTLQWTANVSPCTVTGGSAAFSSLAEVGAVNVTESAPATYTYTLTCGTGSRAATAQTQATFWTPAVTLTANSTVRRLDQLFTLTWQSLGADQCLPSGGGAGDGWTDVVFASTGNVPLQEQTPGGYNFVLSCSAGNLSVQTAVRVNFANDPAFVTLTASSQSLPFGNPLTLTWTSNVDNCSGSGTSASGMWNTSWPPQGVRTILESAAGTYTYVMSCGSGALAARAQVTVAYTGSKTTAQLSSTASAVAVGQPYTLTWSSTNAFSCSGQGNLTLPALSNPSGSMTFDAATPGTFFYVLDCQAGNQSASAQTVVTVGPPPMSGPGPGSGGGGSLDAAAILLLAALALRRCAGCGRVPAVGEPAR